MPRIALGLVVVGLLAILLALVLVVGDATRPGGVPPIVVAALAAFGGMAMVGGLWLLEPRQRNRSA
jgi:formate-dependent nitrite reductase membrane component NrfD